MSCNGSFLQNLVRYRIFVFIVALPNLKSCAVTELDLVINLVKDFNYVVKMKYTLILMQNQMVTESDHVKLVLVLQNVESLKSVCSFTPKFVRYPTER